MSRTVQIGAKCSTGPLLVLMSQQSYIAVYLYTSKYRAIACRTALCTCTIPITTPGSYRPPPLRSCKLVRARRKVCSRVSKALVYLQRNELRLLALRELQNPVHARPRLRMLLQLPQDTLRRYPLPQRVNTYSQGMPKAPVSPPAVDPL